MFRTIAALVLATLLTMSSCAGDDSQSSPPSTTAGVTTEPTSAPLPNREPDATGTLTIGVEEVQLSLISGDDRFANVKMHRLESATLVDADGEPFAAVDLQDGDAVEVWLDPGCAESLPLQCTVEAMRLLA